MKEQYDIGVLNGDDTDLEIVPETVRAMGATIGKTGLAVDCTVAIGRSDDDSFPEASDAFVLRFAAANTELTVSAPTIRSRQPPSGFELRILPELRGI